MNPLHTRLLAGLLQSCVVAAPLLVGSHSASAAEGSASCVALSNHDARLVAKADESPMALRRYVEQTYAVYHVRVDDARAQTARAQQVVASCR